MLPFLREGRDTVCIERFTGRLKRLDVAFYRNAGGAFVLHRVVRVLPDGYDICGDHLLAAERGVPDSRVLGIMTGFFRGGRYIPCISLPYRLLSSAWAMLRPVRVLAEAARHLLGRVKRKLARCLKGGSTA